MSPYSKKAAEEAKESETGAKKNDVLTDMAGDAAASAVEQSLTTENVQAASQYATKENAEAAWEGAKWAD